MFDKSEISKKVDRIFDLAEKSGAVQLRVPFYFAEVRFELLFFYFFWLDYREYNDLDVRKRRMILDEFLNRVANEFDDKNALKKANFLHHHRIDKYFQISKNSDTIGAFLLTVTKYIGALALFFQENDYPFYENIETVFNQISNDKIGELSEPIANSILLHAHYLF